MVAHASVVMVPNKFSNIVLVEQCGLIFLVGGIMISQVVGKILRSCTRSFEVKAVAEQGCANH